MPLAVYGGRRDVMEKVSPLGAVYQAGTLSGNPLAVSAGLATLALLDAELYRRLEVLGDRLAQGLSRALTETGVTGTVQRVGSMLTLFFHPGPVKNWSDASACDRERFARWHHALLEGGVYWPPSQFEAAFVSVAHTEAEIDRTIDVARAALGAS
jgi:glutamate-1-semialdehyde 2,1-aminomutase